MKKRLTRGETWLFASPLIFLAVVGAVWVYSKAPHDTIEITAARRGTDYSLEFSPDGKRLFVSYLHKNDAGRTKRVYEVQSHSKICDLASSASMVGSYEHFSWSPDAKTIVGSDLQNLALWDAQSGKVKVDSPYASTKNFFRAGKIQFSPDGKTLVGEGVPPTIYNLKTIQPLRKSDSNIYKDDLAILSENGRWLAVSDYGTKFQVLDYQTKRVIWKPKLPWTVTFQWFGDILCLENKDFPNHLLLWNARTHQQLPSPPTTPAPFSNIFKFSPNHRTLVCVIGPLDAPNDLWSKKFELALWDYRSHRALWRNRLPGVAKKLQWSPDGKWLATILFPDDRDTLQVFDQSGKLRYECKDVKDARFSPDSKQLAMVLKKKVFFHTSVFVEFHRL